MINKSEYRFVSVSVASLYLKPTFKSELVTQALYSEKLLILEKNDDWFKVRQWDNYESWIHSFYLCFEIDFSKESYIDCNIKNLLNIANSYLDVPYLWGGKSKLGFDCSGFVQTVYKKIGILLPRDTSKQIKSKKLKQSNYSKIKSGDLLFFKKGKYINHIAIYIGNRKIIHASGKVKIEKLENNTKLFKSLYKIFTIPEFKK